jgi:uncharacterized protein DUF6516
VNPAQALDDYFEHVVSLFAGLGTARLVQRRAVALEGASDGVLGLEIEYQGIQLSAELDADVSLGYPVWISYRFHVQRSDGTCLFRYDYSPHHRELSTFPHHKHVGAGEHVGPAEQPSIHRIVGELGHYLGA